MAKDVFHQQVKNALIKDGWTITHDPLTIRISEAVKLQIDLAAESAIAAERDSEKKAIAFLSLKYSYYQFSKKRQHVSDRTIVPNI